MRESIKSIGLILALIIASVSLPIGIIGFGNQPIINNYYTNNYYSNNTTIINNNTTIYNNNTYIEPEPEQIEPMIFPLIKNNYVFCNNAINHEENTEYMYWNYTYNATNDFRMDLWTFENVSIGNAYYYIYDLAFYDEFEWLYTSVDIGSNGHRDYRFPYASTWLIVFEMNANLAHSDPHVNMTVWHQVREVY